MKMDWEESAVVMPCEGEDLVGIVAAPIQPSSQPSSHGVGVVIVVGGPQYRAGSHRQFTLLARRLATAGFATLRFDYRGMGDSSGAARTFEDVAPDLRAAIDALLRHGPQLRSVVLWGLCDAASAAMLYAPTDARVSGLALVNPWARGSDTYARTQLKHYYLQRLMSADFWRKVLRGGFNVRRAGADLRSNISQATTAQAGGDYRGRMLDAMQQFKGSALLLLGAQDLTGQEFELYLNAQLNHQPQRRSRWQQVQRVQIAEADHTFSRAAWHKQMEDATADWLNQQYEKQLNKSPGS